MTLKLTVNAIEYKVRSEPDTPLVYVLRDELKLKGTKLGCGLEQCGSCAVLVDGEPVLSCVSPVSVFEGKAITTIEGVADRETGRRVQDAFIAFSAMQCGYCTAGIVVATTALLEENPAPSRGEITKALTPHLCRCGSHPRVLRAVEEAAKT